MRSHFFFASVTLVAITWASLGSPASAMVMSAPAPDRQTFTFPVCSTTTQLDCLESIKVLRDGRQLIATLDEEPQSGDSHWSYTDVAGEAISLQVLTTAQIPGGVWIEVFRRPDDGHPFMDLDQIACRAGNLMKCIQGFPLLPEGDRIQMTVRTSWLRYMGAGLQGHDMAFSRERYRDGERFVISGKQNLLVIPESWDGPVDSWVAHHYEPRLYVALDHAGTNGSDSAYDPRCASKGGPIRATNAPNAGQPRWRSDSQSLEFGVYAPHLGPDGNLYKGHFEAQFPVEWIRCQAQQPRLNLARFVVQVLGENGIDQAATTSIRVRRGIVNVLATNFHYSSPRIVLTRKSSGPLLGAPLLDRARLRLPSATAR